MFKNRLFIILMVTLLYACAYPKFTIGMTEQDFIKKNKSAVLVQTDEDLTIYRITRVAMTSDPGNKFFYFTNGKLFRMDRGVRRPDILIESN